MKKLTNISGASCERLGLILDRVAAAALKYQPRRTAVFMFHSVMKPSEAVASNDVDFHSPEVFRCFLACITQQAHVKSHVEATASPGGNRNSKNRYSAILTFDDGFLDHYTEVFPLLQQYGLQGTFFIPTSLIGRPRGLSRSMVREMSDHGMIIGSHSATHCRLSHCEPSQLRRELTESKNCLENLTGRACDQIAYPYGHYNDSVKVAVLSAGYTRAFASSPSTSIEDTFALPRVTIPDTLSRWRYTSALYDAGRWRRLLSRNEGLDRFVHGTLGYNSARLHWPRVLR